MLWMYVTARECSLCNSFFPALFLCIMAPKVAMSPRAKKAADMKAAGKVLLAQQEKQKIDKQKKDLKSEMTKLAKDRKKQERKMRTLKAKAQKIDLTELMQMLMMKAFLLQKNATDMGLCSSASSSSEAWVPKDGPDALNKLTELAGLSTDPEVVSFAATLRSQTDDA